MNDLTVRRTMALPPSTLYRAWTSGWATWFAEPDSIRMRPVVGLPWFLEVGQRLDDGTMKRHPHYGRFLELIPNELVKVTWVTGPGGTGGVETKVTARFAKAGDGTEITLTHEGFSTAEARDHHEKSWPMVLEQQEKKLAALGDAVSAVHDGASLEALRPNRSIPDASVIPVRKYPDLDAAVKWLREALGFVERLRIHGHRVQFIAGGGAMIAGEWDQAASPATGGRPPATLMIRVANVDTTYERAIAMGATGVTPPTDYPYGERQAMLRDPAGHSWTLTQTIADVDPAQWGGELV